MQTVTNTNIEHIIAKIDNDFNPDNSDWIPRVAAWTIDAMSQIDILKKERKRKKITVNDRIAISDCPINEDTVRIYDRNGCEIVKAEEQECSCNVLFMGECQQTDTISTTSIVNNDNNNKEYILAETVNDKYPYRYNVHHYKTNEQKDRNYVITNNNIELNFDTDYIYIEQEFIVTYHSETYHCELPVVPNNGVLIEAIAYYCIYKMLCRGYNHPIFNLRQSQYGTNPYYMWTTMKEEARRSIINNGVNEDVTSIFRSNFFIETFDPKRQ